MVSLPKLSDAFYRLRSEIGSGVTVRVSDLSSAMHGMSGAIDDAADVLAISRQHVARLREVFRLHSEGWSLVYIRPGRSKAPLAFAKERNGVYAILDDGMHVVAFELDRDATEFALKFT